MHLISEKLVLRDELLKKYHGIHGQCFECVRKREFQTSTLICLQNKKVGSIYKLTSQGFLSVRLTRWTRGWKRMIWIKKWFCGLISAN